ncbi:hypothetical protein GSI_01659 [Ganoderma sinense ZZ0214-1]|uniref:Uncharacterized protein n=1 Tax=Ganoderma sinense ZZ0214-1 TaxID=1077348 RepID=A0A2G8SQE8_9APHY|nr:hypothetical protein GSI_01659 [Ganoderma sinense ZZ0214-1]
MVVAARNAALSASGNLHARGLSTSMHSPSGSGRSGSSPGSQRVSSEHAHTSARSNHVSLPRTPPYAEPLHMLQTSIGPVSWTPGTPASGNNILGLDARGVRASPRTTFKSTTLHHGSTPAGSILSLDMAVVGLSSMQRSPVSQRGSPADSVGTYSLGSDGFPRPSRRVPQRRGTIQSTTSLPRSNPSRQGSANTHSSHASSAGGRLHSSRQSSMQTSNSSHSRPSLDSAKHPGSYASRRSDDRRGRPAYARAPSSLRTSSVPPENRASPYGVARITDSPGRYYN